MTEANVERARSIVGWYTLVATGTGAIPVPATSVAVVVNNGFMLAHVGAAMGAPLTWTTVVESLGVAGTLNIAGRSVFIEAAKVLSWGTGSLWAAVALSAAGATTAGLQTYVVGLLAIAIAQNGGEPVAPEVAARTVEEAKRTYGDFVKDMTKKKMEKKLEDPGPPPAAATAAVDAIPTKSPRPKSESDTPLPK